MIKVKFSTYLEVDLGGMTTEELIDLKKQIEIRLDGRLNPKDVTLSVVLDRDNNCHTRIGYAIKQILNKPVESIKLSEIPQAIQLEQLQNFRNLGKKSIETLNQILVQNGVQALIQ